MREDILHFRRSRQPTATLATRAAGGFGGGVKVFSFHKSEQTNTDNNNKRGEDK